MSMMLMSSALAVFGLSPESDISLLRSYFHSNHLVYQVRPSIMKYNSSVTQMSLRLLHVNDVIQHSP